MFGSFFISGISLAAATLISTGAGRVGEVVVTSREVMINHLVEEALFQSSNKRSIEPRIQLSNIKAPEFIKTTTSVLFETAIFLEAESFSASTAADTLVEKKALEVQKTFKANKAWKGLMVESHELSRVIRQKLRAKDFIRFKMDSAAIPISDKEAEDYFKINRLKFENLSFEQFKDNIKSYLTKQQTDRRLKDWFELLQSKYRIRNFLVEQS